MWRCATLQTLNGGGAFIDSGLGSEDGAMLLFTSGSTGRPKGVLLRHGSLICNADGVLRHTGTSPQDRLLHVMPLYHTNGVNNQLIVPLLAGASVILLDRFRPEPTIEALRRDAPTYMTGVPTIYARMLPHLTSGERFPSLRFLRCGSAPITPALHQQIEEAFGVPLVVSYGLSEATCTSTMNPPDRRKIGTIGTVLAGQEVRLFDPVTNAEVATGSEGEIRIAGPTLMAGYLGSAEQPIVDGWLADRRPRALRRRGLPLDYRAHQGCDHPRRREHLARPDRAASCDTSRHPRVLRRRRAGRHSWRGADRLCRAERRRGARRARPEGLCRRPLLRASMCLPRSVGSTCCQRTAWARLTGPCCGAS